MAQLMVIQPARRAYIGARIPRVTGTADAALSILIIVCVLDTGTIMQNFVQAVALANPVAAQCNHIRRQRFSQRFTGHFKAGQRIHCLKMVLLNGPEHLFNGLSVHQASHEPIFTQVLFGAVTFQVNVGQG